MALLLLLGKLQRAAGWAGGLLHGVLIPLQPAGRHRQLLLCHHMPLRDTDRLKEDSVLMMRLKAVSLVTHRKAGCAMKR